ncbi:histidine kinase [Crateriforma conspicua]|uniref:Uncharacterized protein n=1 Tax=Crateriforma conspicua TaxID=2527996 RepID=A0A5C5YAE7_9PLAN|nr:HAMP domain-containing histidine kinase [Crateriforma conspicua]QDV65885.1 hypothetical protein Mal65_50580 [Crateriforma conspicua]TWT71285.1 hypothetical protein Pan14r_35950 [Crateriforma conspicua]
MSHLSIDPGASVSLALLVETVTAPMLMAHPAPVCLEVDIDPSIPVPADPALTTRVVRSIASQVLAELDAGGDLMITACQTDSAVELEIADDGPDIDKRSRSIPIAVAEAGAKLNWQNCPQGGAAVTIVFPRRSAASQKPESRSVRRAA